MRQSPLQSDQKVPSPQALQAVQRAIARRCFPAQRVLKKYLVLRPTAPVRGACRQRGWRDQPIQAILSATGARVRVVHRCRHQRPRDSASVSPANESHSVRLRSGAARASARQPSDLAPHELEALLRALEHSLDRAPRLAQRSQESR